VVREEPAVEGSDEVLPRDPFFVLLGRHRFQIRLASSPIATVVNNRIQRPGRLTEIPDSGDAEVFVAIVLSLQEVEVRRDHRGKSPPLKTRHLRWSGRVPTLSLTSVSSSPIASERSASASNGRLPGGGTMKRKDAVQS
jgi:hypothetical protein